MTDDVTKRANYFDRQFLRAADFKVDQAYYIDRRRRLNRVVFTPGVILDPLVVEAPPNTGNLLVTGKTGDSTVTVQQGAAIDALGEEMVVLSPQIVSFSKANAGSTLNIYIEYADLESDPGTDGITGNTRVTESPAFPLGSTPPNTNKDILLASVTLDGAGKLTGPPTDSRVFATTVPSDLVVTSLSLRYGSDPSKWPKFTAGKANEADLAGDLNVTGTVFAKAFQGDGSKLTNITATDNTKVAKAGDTMTGELKLAPGVELRIEGGKNPNDNADYFSFGGNGSFGIDAPGVPDGRFVVQNSGKVGVGTAGPGRRLHVNSDDWNAGAEILASGSTAGLSFSDRVANWVFGDTSPGYRWVWYSNSKVARLWTSVNGDVMTVDSNGNLTINGLITEEDWTAPTLLNSWANYAGYNPAGYFRDKLGIVHLRGLVQGGTTIAYDPPQATIFQLPAGYRPANRELHGVISNNAIGRCDVLPTGEVKAIQGSNGWFQLDGITFRAVSATFNVGVISTVGLVSTGVTARRGAPPAKAPQKPQPQPKTPQKPQPKA